MNPKEQWKAFFEHRYTNNAVPSLEGFAFFMDTVGLPETIKGTGNDSGKDWFGAEWVRDTSMNEVLPDPLAEPVLDDIENWRERIAWPDLDDFDWDTAVKIDKVSEVNRDTQFLIVGVNQGPFERLHTLMGFENALIALMVNPDECETFFAEWMQWRLYELEKINQYYQPDAIIYHDDVGTQNDLFFSPELWRKIFKPLLKAACDKCHEMGAFFEYHSCGKIERIITDLVDIGVDVWQGQEINDVVKLKSITKDNLGYHMMPNYQALISRSDTGITEDEVRKITRADFLKNLEGGQYSPLMLPFGDWVSGVIADELMGKISFEFQGNPAG